MQARNLFRTSWLLAAIGLVAAMLVLSAASSQAAQAPDPVKKGEPKKEEPKKPARPELPFPFPDIENLLPPGAIDPEQMKELKQVMEELMKQLQQRGNAGGIRIQPLRGARFPFGGDQMETRMGASIESPTDTLVDQLNLPAKQGIVLKEVKPDSAAAKAGMKSHDILLELNGKPVPSDMDEFQKQLKDIKVDAKVDAVVLRKGKKETIKDLTLPEAKEDPNNPFRNFQQLFPNGNVPGAIFPGNAQRNITMTRNADGTFTANQDHEGVKYTVTGKLENRKAKVEGIEIKDAKETKKYKTVDEVPEAQRETVKNLIQTAEGRGGLRFNLRQIP